METKKTLTPEQFDALIAQHEQQIEKLRASKDVVETEYTPELNPDGSAVGGTISEDQRAAEEKRIHYKGVVAVLERERQRIAATNTVFIGDSRISEKAATEKFDEVLGDLIKLYTKII